MCTYNQHSFNSSIKPDLSYCIDCGGLSYHNIPFSTPEPYHNKISIDPIIIFDSSRSKELSQPLYRPPSSYLSIRKRGIEYIRILSNSLDFKRNIFYKAILYLDLIYSRTTPYDCIENVSCVCVLLAFQYNKSCADVSKVNHLFDLIKTIPHFGLLEIFCLVVLGYDLGHTSCYDYLHSMFTMGIISNSNDCCIGIRNDKDNGIINGKGNVNNNYPDYNNGNGNDNYQALSIRENNEYSNREPIDSFYNSCIDFMDQLVKDDRFLDFSNFNIAMSIIRLQLKKYFNDSIDNTNRALTQLCLVYDIDYTKESLMRCVFVLSVIQKHQSLIKPYAIKMKHKGKPQIKAKTEYKSEMYGMKEQLMIKTGSNTTCSTLDSCELKLEEVIAEKKNNRVK